MYAYTMSNPQEGAPPQGQAPTATQATPSTTLPVPVEVSRLRSADFALLAGALAKAQLRIGNAEKNAENPHFKKPYADLASIREAFRVPLAENEIAFSQVVHTNGRGEMVVTTMLLHTSGQYLEGSIRFKAEDNNPQGTGSKITYMKRYAAAAITGVAASDDDDDGEWAQGRGQEPQRTQGGPRREDQRQRPPQAQQRGAVAPKTAEPPAAAAVDDKADEKLLLIKSWTERIEAAKDKETLKVIANEIGDGPFPQHSQARVTLLAAWTKAMRVIDPNHGKKQQPQAQ